MHVIETIDSVRSASPDCGVVIMGDFNDLPITDIINHHNLKQVVRTPTRGNNILDLIITNLSHMYVAPLVSAPLANSDHNTVEWRPIQSTSHVPLPAAQKHKIRRFPQSSYDAFGRWSASHSWFSNVSDLQSASELASSLSTDIKSAMDSFFPLKSVKIHPTDKPWVSPVLKQLIILRQKAFHSGDKEQWLHYRRRVRKEIDSAKKSFYANKVRHLKKDDPRKWWNCINQLSGKKTTQSSLSINGSSLVDQNLAQRLNDHFISVTADLPFLDSGLLPAFLPAAEPPLTVTPQEVCNKLCKISANKAHGPDGIPSRILKDFSFELATPISSIFNVSLTTGTFPSLWKDAFITPVPKVQPPTSTEDFRPIALTSCISKILEDFVVSWMLEDIGDKIDPNQFGSLKGASTTYCLIDIINNWLKSIDRPSCYLRACFIDFSKAFDRINHNIVVHKLLQRGVRSSLIPLICSFLCDRRQSDKIGHFQSIWAPVYGGVSQGTKLGPILFLVMINDLHLQSGNSLWKYVDDVTLSEVVEPGVNSTLQDDLNLINKWASDNYMRLNIKKCKEFSISFLRNQHISNPNRLNINGFQLDRVSSFKLLGVTLNDKLKWNDHVELMIKKASKRLYIIRTLRRYGIPACDLLSIYIALIRSVLEYACVVWHTSLPKYLSNNIEMVQKRAFRIIYPLCAHYKDALETSRCSSLHDRRVLLCDKTFDKMQEPSSRLRHLIPDKQSNNHNHNLRNKNGYVLPPCRTERYKRSFVPYMCFNNQC